MLCTTSSGSGRVQASESDLWLRPSRGFQLDAHRGGIYCHQGTGTGLSPISSATFAGTVNLVQAIAAAGWPIASQDLGGANPWGNPTAQTRVGQSDAWVIAGSGDTPRGSTSPRIIIGISMGAAAAVNYYGKSPGHVADVAAFVFVIPVWDLDRLYQGDVSGSRAGIETAWSVTYPAALPAGANPKDNTGLLNGKPVLICYSSDDNICDAAQAELMRVAFGTATTTVVSLGALGHTDAAIAAVDIPGVVVPWLRRYAAVAA